MKHEAFSHLKNSNDIMICQFLTIEFHTKMIILHKNEISFNMQIKRILINDKRH